MKFFSLALIAVFAALQTFAQTGVSGTITDDAGKTIPFTSVYLKGTPKGTTANSEGRYDLKLAPGNYNLLFKAIGFKQESRAITITGQETLNISLHPETFELKDVTIRAGGEDPAYAIIRKAIKKRKTYLNEVEAYNCEVYIKGLQKLLEAPKRFMGQDIGQITREMGLDSNRRGIIYLSESKSKLSYKKPDDYHEEMISSKVSGSNRAFSFNRASEMKVNFYDNIQDWRGLSNRPFISPIADNALFYYNYKFIGLTVENGETINKIQVIPKRSYDPAFEGYIYITDDSWRIHSADLYITKRANLFFVDTLKIRQQYMPAEKGAWMPSSVKFEFTGGFLGFRLGGYFVAVFDNYDLSPSFNKKTFNEVMRITADVNKKDSTYWQAERPIPLTAEEVIDYKNKETLAKKRESKEYLDSLDHVHNRFKPGKLLFGGIDTRNRYKREYYHFDSFAGSLLFNTVEGFALNYGANYRKLIDSSNNRFLNLGAHVRYGFSNKMVHGNINGSISNRDLAFSFAAGSDVLDMNNRSTISTLHNTLSSLLWRQNFQKLYDKEFLRAGITGRIAGTWLGGITAEYANRKWLPNTTNYAFNNKTTRQYTSNNPLTPNIDQPLFPENQSLKVTLRTSYDFSNKYSTYPNGRHYLPSKYPRLSFAFTHAFKDVLGSDADYNLLTAELSKENIGLGMLGHSSFLIGAGKFLTTNQLYYIDYKHFSGNEIFPYQPGMDKFLLLNYYGYSTPDKYIEGHFEHNFSGFILNKIPLIRKLKLQEIINFNYLSTPALHNYMELGAGAQYLGFRLMYARSFNSGANTISALKLGIGF